MLAELRVQGLAVIRDARLELGPGLNVLTGETGAGKSMLVDALALLLGERAASDLVRPGAARCVVEGAFELDAAPRRRSDRLGSSLERAGVELDGGRLILKREIQASGKSRAWVNGSPATAGTLAELGSLLVDLHGQHETQSLLRAESQRAILDLFADAATEAAAVAEAYEERERLSEERGLLETRQAEARRRADYLKHVADEIARAAPQPGELEALEAEARRLGHAEELARTAEELAGLVSGDDRAATHALARASRLLATVERLDPPAALGWRQMLEAAMANADELSRAARSYAESLDLDPARLAEVERRRDVLYRLDQKYGPGIERVITAGEEAGSELALLDTAGVDLADLTRRVSEAGDRLVRWCEALSAKRRAAARRLGTAVSKRLTELGMPGGTVRVALESLELSGRHGAERVEFVCSLNPGMGERPVAKAASGGELSRLMLALKVELVRHDRVPTLVFDEVDQGIGGKVAGRVADALARVAEQHQVLVITHLPPIAAAAQRHVVVSKSAEDGAAETEVSIVEGEQRVAELARMLGGARATARRHALEMLKAVRA